VSDVGSARVEITGDVSRFAGEVRRDLSRILREINVDPVEIPLDTDAVSRDSQEAGQKIGDQVTRGADGRLRDSRGRFVAAGTQAGEAIGDGVTRGLMADFGTVEEGS
jgi:hypothetical protein